MKIKKISLQAQIKKVIGNRILFCSTIFIIIISGLTISDLSNSITQLKSRIDEQLKPVEDFVIDQAMIDNLDTVELKIESFNEGNTTFKITWIRNEKPVYKKVTWMFPFFWVYDYRIGNIAGYQLGFLKVTGDLLSDKALLYDFLIRLILLFIFTGSILIILYPLAKRIPEQLFINPINRFIDLISNNPSQNNFPTKSLPVELEMLEVKILDLLRTATELERNKADIELGHISARLAHDIRSPLAAMEMGIRLLSKKVSLDDLNILINSIQSVRDISSKVLEQYRNPHNDVQSISSTLLLDDNNVSRPILLSSVCEFMLLQKRHEWDPQPGKLILTVNQEAKISWVNAAPNEVKRILSNLLNNANDALSKKSEGVIEITLDKVNDNLTLYLTDNGVGIPAERVSDVLQGVSLKHAGKGLGLSVANQYMINLGGSLEIESTFGTGTKITLAFPQAKNIEWFPETISLNNITIAIVLDDDFSMLAYWQQRLKSHGLKAILFSNYQKAMRWINHNREILSSTIFLADYELAHSEHNGLSLLDKIKSHHRYLITSYAENFKCQSAISKSGVWLIPKTLSDYVVIN